MTAKKVEEPAVEVPLAPLAVGDKARVKGMDGAPAMTVRNVRGADVDCHWFDVGGGYNRESFHASELEAAPVETHAAHKKPTDHGPHVTK